MGQNSVAVSPLPSGAIEEAPEAVDIEGDSPAQRVRGINGISQSLELFGKSFHLQTEVCDGRLRTEIFDGGRVIATRKARLGRVGAKTLRLRMSEFHRQVLSGILERATRYREVVAEAKRSDRDRGGPAPRAEGPNPPASAAGRHESVETSFGVRRLLGEFRTHISTSEGSVVERLDGVGPAFARVLSSPLFEHIRVDEQLQFHMLRDQIDTWSDGKDAERAVELWSDTTDFVAYLAGIDNRAIFADIDREEPQESTSESVGREPAGAPPTGAIEQEGEVQAFPSPQPGSPHSRTAGSQWEKKMAQVNLEPLTAIDGFVGSCLVDSDSGMMLGAHGGGNLELAAAGNTQVVRAKRKTMASLKLDDRIEDILISLKKQYHLIRILESNPAIFLYLVLDRDRANLAMARLELRSFETALNLG